MAHLVAVNRSDCRTDPKVDIGGGELRAGYGLVSDSHAGLGEREVSLVALESIEAANRQYGIEAGPGSFADNLTTQGIDLLTLKLGDRLRVGVTLLEVVQIGKTLDASHTYNFHGVSILPKYGIFCNILEGGYVNKGDVIEVVKSESSNS
ncbi:MAG: MOSC domain-containing protein [Anaerolineae bacterium]|nr:MOSC domain-containing protein [Anaerolineae bacterium]